MARWPTAPSRMEPSLTAAAQQPMQVHRTPEVLAVLTAVGVRLTEVAAQPTAAVVVNLMAADTTSSFARPRTTEAAKPDSFAAFFLYKIHQCSCSGITAY